MGDAVATACSLLGLPAGAPGTAHEVRRLDRDGERYTIVHVAGHVVCLDAKGALMSSGVSSRSPIGVSRDEALTLAMAGDEARVELVWWPSAASMAMTDPLWRVVSGARTQFVDQRGRVLQGVGPKRPGG